MSEIMKIRQIQITYSVNNNLDTCSPNEDVIEQALSVCAENWIGYGKLIKNISEYFDCYYGRKINLYKNLRIYINKLRDDQKIQVIHSEENYHNYEYKYIHTS